MSLVHGDGNIYSDSLIDAGYDTTCPNGDGDRVMYDYHNRRIYCTRCGGTLAYNIESYSAALNWFIADGRKMEGDE
jgi:transcription initiation factor TFIIIB Brf1 subunit/transcription initiation factor TFIIB